MSLFWDDNCGSFADIASDKAKQELRDGVNVYRFDGNPAANMALLLQNRFGDAEEFCDNADGQIMAWIHLYKFFDNWYSIADRLNDLAGQFVEEVSHVTAAVMCDGRQEVNGLGKRCQEEASWLLSQIRATTLDRRNLFDTGSMFKCIKEHGSECAKTFSALLMVYKQFRREHRLDTPDTEDIVQETKEQYSALCDRYSAFLKVEELERKRISRLITKLQDFGVTNSETLYTLKNRTEHLADLAKNIDSTIDLLMYLITCVKTEYDLKRLEDLNRPLVLEIDNYMHSRASFLCELQYFLISLDKGAVSMYRDILYNHRWSYWQEDAEK